MLTCDNFLYAALQKTGSSQIKEILRRNFPVEDFGSHQAATREQVEAASVRMGSIRNPWTWYLSLWRFGCRGRGGLFQSLDISAEPGWADGKARGEAPSVPPSRGDLKRSDEPDAQGEVVDREAWRRVYADAESAGGFREWLHMIHHPPHRFAMSRAWGKCLSKQWMGYLSFRFVRIYTTKENRGRMIGQLDSSKAFEAFLSEACYVTHWVRTEHLEDDLFACLAEAGHQVSEEKQALLRSLPRAKENPRTNPIEFYYDDESRRLVAERDEILIERFGYSFPEC